LQDPMGPLAERLANQNSRKWLQMRTGFTIQHEIGDPTTPRRLWKIQGLHKLAVPRPQERKALITRVHSTNGHWGVNRNLALLARHNWMPHMEDKVEEVVKGCDACQRTRATFDGHHPILHPLPIMGPYYRWSLDLATMPHITKRGNKYVVVMIEHYSRYIALAAIPKKEAKHVAAV